MTRMVIDGLTAALIAPVLAREGWTMADFASSLRTALSGSYRRVHLTQLKRDAMVADFVIGMGPASTNLLVPGADAFSPPGDSIPMRGAPAMWGSVLRIDGRLELRPNAIRCHADVIAMPSRSTGRFLVTGVELPQTVRAAAAGRMLGDVISIDGFDLPSMVIKDIRDAREDDHKRIELTHGGNVLRIGTALAPPPIPGGIVIAVVAGDVVAYDAG